MKYKLEAHDPRRPRIHGVEELDAPDDDNAVRIAFGRADTSDMILDRVTSSGRIVFDRRTAQASR